MKKVCYYESNEAENRKYEANLRRVREMATASSASHVNGSGVMA
jgi:hypothetical protein